MHIFFKEKFEDTKGYLEVLILRRTDNTMAKRNL
jgi:hypothetical protein